VLSFADVTKQKIRGAHRFGSFVVVGRNEWIGDLVRPWMKKPHLHLLPHPLPPIRLVVVAVFQERGFRKLVIEVVVASLPLLSSKHQCFLGRVVVAPEADDIVPVVPVVFVVPEATGPVLDAAFEFRVPLHVFGVSIPVFPFPEDQRRSLHHCHWCH